MPEPDSIIIIIAALILASGFFSLFERALRQVRKPRLQKETGKTGTDKRYRRLLAAAENPDRYYRAASFWMVTARTCAVLLAGLNIEHLTAAQDSSALAILSVVAAAVLLICAILIVGSFLPRIIASRSPEPVAAAILPLFAAFALPVRPFFLVIQHIEQRLHTVFPPKDEQHGMTEDELRHALIEGEKSGIVESKEKIMVEGVFYLGDRPLGTFMTHRSDIQWIDIQIPAEELRTKVLEHREQRCFPVADGTLDSIIGAAYTADIIIDLASDSPAGLRAIMRKPLFAPETMPALKAFESFSRGKADFLFVMDEYGGFAGMISLHDLMEEIVGELTASANENEETVQQDDGTLLADGSLNIDDAAKLLSLPELSAAHGDYHTLAGFVLSLAGELPHTGDHFTYQGYRFTVLDMDGNRIDKIGIEKPVTNDDGV
jgi:putative hemolysin